MAIKIPQELKKITQFVRRAEELDNDRAPQSRIVAYYCRQYAVQIGITLAKTPAAKVCLSELLGDLEKEKVAMSNFTNKECYQVCRGFALKIFDKADGEDRAGGAGKATARTFYAAATFLDLLKQFYDNGIEKSEETIEEEKKSFYSKWKATEILKALKEGREPTPGGYGEGGNSEKEEGEEAEELGGDDVPFQTTHVDALSSPGEEDIPKAPVCKPQIPPEEEPSKIFTLIESMGTVFGISQSSKLTRNQILDGKELCSIALKSFHARNAPLVGQRLNEALVCLGQTPAQNSPSYPQLNNRAKLALQEALEAIESKDKAFVIEKIQEALVHMGFS